MWPSGDGMLINTHHCDNAWYLLISEWKSWYYNGEDNSYFVRFVLFDKRAALFVVWRCVESFHLILGPAYPDHKLPTWQSVELQTATCFNQL